MTCVNVASNLYSPYFDCPKQIYQFEDITGKSNLIQCLALCCHPDTVRFLTGVTDAHGVVGSYAEVVLPRRVKARAHPVARVLTAACQLSPVPRLAWAHLPPLHHVAGHGRAAVVAGARPGEHQRAGRQLGHEGAGGWRMGSVWTDTDWKE